MFLSQFFGIFLLFSIGKSGIIFSDNQNSIGIPSSFFDISDFHFIQQNKGDLNIDVGSYSNNSVVYGTNKLYVFPNRDQSSNFNTGINFEFTNGTIDDILVINKIFCKKYQIFKETLNENQLIIREMIINLDETSIFT